MSYILHEDDLTASTALALIYEAIQNNTHTMRPFVCATTILVVNMCQPQVECHRTSCVKHVADTQEQRHGKQPFHIESLLTTSLASLCRPCLLLCPQRLLAAGPCSFWRCHRPCRTWWTPMGLSPSKAVYSLPTLACAQPWPTCPLTVWMMTGTRREALEVEAPRRREPFHPSPTSELFPTTDPHPRNAKHTHTHDSHVHSHRMIHLFIL